MSDPTSPSTSTSTSSTGPEAVASPSGAADSRLDRWLAMLDLPVLRDDKPRVGVSACLLGRLVRYNGEAKRHGTVADVLPRWLQFTEYCPEVAIGLPVPRPPVDIIATETGQQIRNRDGLVADITDALHACADDVCQQNARTDKTPPPDGMILKARSPSCGPGNTPLLNTNGQQIGITHGGFAARLKTHCPDMPMVHEEQLVRAVDIEVFVLRVFLYREQRRWGNDGKNVAWCRDMRARIMTLPSTDIRARLLQQLEKQVTKK
ncbi:DUF523 domain-containing protein [Alcanivorax sp. JB21]|uniref:DUF523 domain-containing protein n=1 Tax=Alcanivorax limicola TaxID=2874102 RepID=UPI001CBF288D|nr:DUF523 domain-containing protein [Alcanivorax limicola]MBZ2190397.1 DUF523 domain-containing protein [Alcanivorax limicola]